MEIFEIISKNLIYLKIIAYYNMLKNLTQFVVSLAKKKKKKFINIEISKLYNEALENYRGELSVSRLVL